MSTLRAQPNYPHRAGVDKFMKCRFTLFLLTAISALHAAPIAIPANQDFYSASDMRSCSTASWAMMLAGLSLLGFAPLWRRLPRHRWRRSLAWAHLSLLCWAVPAGAGTISISGIITQSPADSGVPAVQNPSLNQVADGDTYHVQLTINDSFTGPGNYSLTDFKFVDSTAGVTETGFISASMAVWQSGATDQFSVLGCLPGCAFGNQLALEFFLPASVLYSTGSPTQVPGLLPMDLLEDDGSTDIHGTVTSYTNDGPAPVGTPEPWSFGLMGSSLVAIGLLRRYTRQ